MVIILPCPVAKSINDTILDKREKDIVDKARYYLDSRDPERKVRFDIAEFSDESLQKIHDFLAASASNKSLVRARNAVSSWQSIKKNPSGAKCGLDSFPNVMRQYMRKNAPRRWLFFKDEDGQFLPVFISGIHFHESTRFKPAHVTFSTCYYNLATGKVPSDREDRGNGTETITIYRRDVTGKTIVEVLMEKGYYVETPELVANYKTAMEKWQQFEGEVGLQVVVAGRVTNLSGWYESRRKKRPAERAGVACRMVVDPGEREVGSTAIESKFWAGIEDLEGDIEDFILDSDDEDEDEDDGERKKKKGKKKAAKEEETEDPTRLWEVPVHPYLELFDLEEHVRVAAHVNNCSEYVYDEKVGEKLVLPEDVKDLIEALIHEAGESFSDIVEGKSGGVIVLITGTPGTGKTLTAEVYSEVMKRPLYKVNSSQLGVSIEEIEKELKTVLQRAERWKAILLIDEADVYVHERGDDIVQNAIVGVFLRVLEYYRGVLFLTSNRGTIVDDAIISRLTARMEYAKPNDEERGRIWRIIAEQNGIKLEDFEVASLVRDLPGISGRDIKMLIKLAKMYSHRKGVSVDAALVKRLNKFKSAEKEKPNG